MKRKPRTKLEVETLCEECWEPLEDCTCNKCHNCGEDIDSDTSEGHPDFPQDMHCYECLKEAYEEKVEEAKAELKRIKDKLKLMRRK